MKIDVRELVISAFKAGFSASSEGYNGEYPFNFDEVVISREIHERARDHWDLAMSAVDAESSK